MCESVRVRESESVRVCEFVCVRVCECVSAGPNEAESEGDEPRLKARNLFIHASSALKVTRRGRRRRDVRQFSRVCEEVE